MADVNVMIGLPGSGKTTQAKMELNSYPKGEAVMVSRDGLRDLMFGTRIGLNGSQENLVTVAEQKLADTMLAKGISVIIDDQNLRMDYRKPWANLAGKHGASYRQIDLTDVSLETCLERNEGRLGERFVPRSVITDNYNRYVKGKEYPKPSPAVTEALRPSSEPYVAVRGTPKAVIVDIDGTVALHEGVRSPYDPTKYHLDKPNLPVIDMVREQHYELGYKILFCSGRENQFYDVTYEWLMDEVKVPVEALIMREHKGVSDDIEKLWLFDTYIRDSYDVRRVFDDRNRVVEAWRSIGLPVFQVANGDF